jgi:hypothetical protein
MIDTNAVLLGGALPAVVAAVAMLGAWKLGKHAGVAWLVGVSLGYLTGHWALDAHGVGLAAAVAKSFSPHEARDWLPLAVISAAALEAIGLLGKKAIVLSWVLRVGWCFWLPWRLLAGSVYLPSAAEDLGFDTGAWSTSETAAWLGGVGGLLVLAWLALRQASTESLPRLRPRLQSSLATFVALGATATITLSGSFTIGQLMGVLTATLVGCGIAAAALRLESGPEAAAGPLLASFAGVLVIARFLLVPELPLYYAGMLLLALVVAVGWIAPPKLLSARFHSLVRIAVCVAVLALVVVPAARDFAASQAVDESNPYLNYTE